MMTPFFVERIEEEVGALPGTDDVKVKFDARFQWSPDMITEEGERKREQV